MSLFARKQQQSNVAPIARGRAPMRLSPALVYDVTNILALVAIAVGVWSLYGSGAALICIGALALALNVLILLRRR